MKYKVVTLSYDEIAIISGLLNDLPVYGENKALVYKFKRLFESCLEDK